MKKILIFSGTGEGRKLAEYLSKREIPVLVSVATEYGKIVMKENPYLTIREGRLDEQEMTAFLRDEQVDIVIDATHPFATVVSENIKEAVMEVGVSYLRLKRNVGEKEVENNCFWFADTLACARALEQTKGNVLLTTGSKELAVFAKEISNKERLFVRVLPSMESLSVCKDNGIIGKQVIAMQGPFSQETNGALLKQYDISVLVTKQTGKSGGFFEKIAAAQACNAKTFIIGSPDKTEGCEFFELLQKLEQLLKIPLQKSKMPAFHLIGKGMGQLEGLTGEAKEALKHADLIFGAKRLLEGLEEFRVPKIPYYQAEEIMEYLLKLPLERRLAISNVAVLFSGDVGFYSGAENFCKVMEEKCDDIRMYPGISSISCFAAKLHTSWQDAKIVSLHGKKADIKRSVTEHKKTFFLLSGVTDVRKIQETLEELIKEGEIPTDVHFHVGYQLSYSDEKIYENITPRECKVLPENGLYVALVEHKGNLGCIRTPGLSDEAFLRDDVPMTKETIREVAICKLHLTKDAILYDIGSGTGSVSIECARLSEQIQVYAIEKKEKAIALLKENCKKFGFSNIRCMHAEAPEGLDKLPSPTHVFIGGSSGNLEEILETIVEKSANVRVVLTAVTLETVAKLSEVIKRFQIENPDITQLSVSRAKELGEHHLFLAENPVYIAAFDLKRREE